MDEQETQAPYFTDEIEEKMKMTDEEMFAKLKALEQTEYWPAILRYNQLRLHVSQGAVFSTDPVKEPTTISRHQGIMLGLSDLQNAVIQLVQTKEEKEEGTKVK